MGLFALYLVKIIVSNFTQMAPLERNAAQMQVRHLNLQEFSSKSLMDKFGVRTQKWRLATTGDEAEKAAKELLKSELPKLNLSMFKALTVICGALL